MVSCNKLFTSTIGDTPMTQSTTQSIIALPEGMEITGEIKPGYEQVLTPAALARVVRLTRAFEPRRQQLLAARSERARRLDAGERPDFLAETAHIRAGDWKIAPIPPALECRRVEITGPVERKMVINAFNSGADSYMTDFEDSNTPNWEQPDHRPDQYDRRGAPHHLAGAERQVLQAQRQDRDAGRASARLAPG